MPRYWVIAPVEAKKPELFERVWQFDLANNVISIGWSELGDVSNLNREELAGAVAAAYPDKPLATRSLFSNMLWAFFHEIVPGDIVIARRGRKNLAAVGDVTETAIFQPGRNPAITHCNFLGVEWHAQPRDKTFGGLVFPMHTLTEFSEVQYRELFEGDSIAASLSGESLNGVDQNAFVLEKYLEEFIVSNFDNIFQRKLEIYADADGADGQQYPTEIGPIDILAVESTSGAFVVIELKKGRPSDQVVGQVLRYMGWVKKNLCKQDQEVKGLVVCHDPDPKVSYALEMVKNVDVRYYRVSFTLRDAP